MTSHDAASLTSLPILRAAATFPDGPDGADGAAAGDDLAIVRQLATAVTASPPAAMPRGRSRLVKVLSVKAVVAAAFVVSGSGAAAAGLLPDAAQDGLARAASHIGINLPSTADDRARDATNDVGRRGLSEQAPDGTAPTGSVSADPADPSHGAPTGSDPAPQQQQSPPADTHGAEVSSTARTTDATGADKGAEVSSTAHENPGHPVPQGGDHPGAEKRSDNAPARP